MQVMAMFSAQNQGTVETPQIGVTKLLTLKHLQHTVKAADHLVGEFEIIPTIIANTYTLPIEGLRTAFIRPSENAYLQHE